MLAESMPTTEQSRAFRLVWTSYAVLAMTDPELAEKPFVEGPNRFEQQLADVLGRARTEGELAPGLDVSAEAALEVLRYHLDSVFGASGKARDSSTSDGGTHQVRYQTQRAQAATGLPTPPPARRYRVPLTRGRSCG
ncbi:TetR family transcriptional regulator C-terminal domain-containing protein [Streptomyces sp. NPDC003006]